MQRERQVANAGVHLHLLLPGGGRIGDAAYAELIAEQLALDNVLKHYMRGAANGPAVDHFLASYETGLRVRSGMREERV